MSRQIDWSQPSEEDIAWALQDEPAETLQRVADMGYDVSELQAEVGTPPGPAYNTENIPSGGSDNEAVIVPGMPDERVSVSEEAEELPPYSEMRKPALQAEARSRGLDDSGTVAELIARLEEDDAANEDATE